MIRVKTYINKTYDVSYKKLMKIFISETSVEVRPIGLHNFKVNLKLKLNCSLFIKPANFLVNSPKQVTTRSLVKNF